LLSGVGLADAAKKPEARKIKKSKAIYSEALRSIEKGDIEKGRELIDAALKFDPENPRALTARELLHQSDIQQHLTNGSRELQDDHRQEAVADFRKALTLDPKSSAAQEGLRAALAQDARVSTSQPKIRYRDAGDIQLTPSDAVHDFHYRGDTRGLLEQVWNAYGVKPLIDTSVTSKPVRFDIDATDFATATNIVSQMTKTFYVPLSTNQALVFANTPETRRNFERLAMRTFYVSEASSAQEINELVTMLRSIFDFRFVTPAASSNQVTVRAPLDMLEAATHVLDDLYAGKPQVMLELNVYQIEQTLARDLGLGLPTQFSLFNVATEARNLLNSPTNQQLINQLISSGAINQANSSSIAALLAGLAAGGQSSILNQPIATFGGGITQSGTIIPGVTGHLSLSKSSFRALDHVYLRASQSDAATFRDGTRFPILNASFAPIFNTAAVSQVLQNQSFIAPFPSFTYEDLGLSFKATPTIHGVTDVTLKLEFQMRGLGAQQLNGVPVITNREYNGIITVPEGETAVLAGMVTRQEQLSLQGIPGLAQLPGLRQATTLNDANMDDAEILVTITPHLVRDSMHNPEAGTAFVPPSSIP
jgi:type II secretory pathway component GspD/PulD (secretin)